MKNLIYTLSIVAVFCFSHSAQAGKVYSGYVVTTDKAFFKGQIEMLSPALNEVKVKMETEAGDRKVFKAKEVQEYGFEVPRWDHNTRQHVNTTIVYVKRTVERAPVAFGPREVLLEQQVSGAVNMYNHFIEQNANIDEPFLHIIYVEREVGTLVEVTRDNYAAVLRDMLSDNAELVAVIGTRGYGFKHIPDILAQYNDWAAAQNGGLVMGME